MTFLDGLTLAGSCEDGAREALGSLWVTGTRRAEAAEGGGRRGVLDERRGGADMAGVLSRGGGGIIVDVVLLEVVEDWVRSGKSSFCGVCWGLGGGSGILWPALCSRLKVGTAADEACIFGGSG